MKRCLEHCGQNMSFMEQALNIKTREARVLHLKVTTHFREERKSVSSVGVLPQSLIGMQQSGPHQTYFRPTGGIQNQSFLSNF